MTREEIHQKLSDALANESAWLDSIKAQLVTIEAIYNEFLTFNTEFESANDKITEIKSLTEELGEKISQAQEITDKIPEINEAIAKIEAISSSIAQIETLKDELEALIAVSKEEIQNLADSTKTELENQKTSAISEIDTKAQEKVQELETLLSNITNLESELQTIQNNCENYANQAQSALETIQSFIENIEDRDFALSISESLSVIKDRTREIALNQLGTDIPVASSQNIGGFRTNNVDGGVGIKTNGKAYVVGFDTLKEKVESLQGSGEVSTEVTASINALEEKTTEIEGNITTLQSNVSTLTSGLSTKANTSEVLKLSSSSMQTISSGVMFNTSVSKYGNISLGGDLSKAACYISLWNNSTRCGYIGYASTGGTDFSFQNDNGGIFLFNTLMKYTSTLSITEDNQIPHKKYVDDTIASAISGNNTSTAYIFNAPLLNTSSSISLEISDDLKVEENKLTLNLSNNAEFSSLKQEVENLQLEANTNSSDEINLAYLLRKDELIDSILNPTYTAHSKHFSMNYLNDNIRYDGNGQNSELLQCPKLVTSLTDIENLNTWGVYKKAGYIAGHAITSKVLQLSITSNPCNNKVASVVVVYDLISMPIASSNQVILALIFGDGSGYNFNIRSKTSNINELEMVISGGSDTWDLASYSSEYLGKSMIVFIDNGSNEYTIYYNNNQIIKDQKLTKGTLNMTNFRYLRVLPGGGKIKLHSFRVWDNKALTQEEINTIWTLEN